MPIFLDDTSNPAIGDTDGLNLIQIVRGLVYQIRSIIGGDTWLSQPETTLTNIQQQIEEGRFMSDKFQIVRKTFANDLGDIVGVREYVEFDSCEISFIDQFVTGSTMTLTVVGSCEDGKASFLIEVLPDGNSPLEIGNLNIDSGRSNRLVINFWHRSQSDFSPFVEVEGSSPLNIGDYMGETDTLVIRIKGKVDKPQAVARLEQFSVVVEGSV